VICIKHFEPQFQLQMVLTRKGRGASAAVTPTPAKKRGKSQITKSEPEELIETKSIKKVKAPSGKPKIVLPKPELKKPVAPK
jgi:hypothetical protein